MTVQTLRAFAFIAAMGLAGHAVGQSYPAKPVRLIVPFPPGGATDVLARTVGQKLGDNLRQQIVIDNRSGASGILGLELTAKAAPDGYTIAIGQANNIAINLAVHGKLPYDPIGIGASLTARSLPHHRAYGSVHGDSAG